ncbi:MAG TPA: Spo0B domain-containing protein [Syntrophomonadaceae bacterium]|nr:Spo0B domain-containing protein [Syntrophomonadaceae bacterium]
MDADKVINLLRRVRHDYGNHLQVISGYTELNRPDAVKEYILEIIREMEKEKRLLEFHNPEIGLFLFEQMLAINDLGVIVIYKELEITSIEKLINSGEPLRTIKKLLEANHIAEDITIEISIRELSDQMEISIYSPILIDNP